MQISSEASMIELGRLFAGHLALPAVFELVGDVGVGKTTFTRGLAEGLGITEPITSPSFTISKRYAFIDSNQSPAELVHYDFYRLNDPGIMRDELSETVASPNSVVIVEWGGDVADLLPAAKYRLEFTLAPDGSRCVKLNNNAEKLLDQKGN